MSDGLILALETSGALGSVALWRDGRVAADAHLPKQGEHAALLVPAVRAVLEEAGAESREVEGIVVGLGPGSFTGVRIAAATARGLSAGLGVPVWGWSSLAGAAASDHLHLPDELNAFPGAGLPRYPEGADGWPRYVLFDARADRVYGACYRIVPGRMEVLVAPHAGTLDDVLDGEVPPNALFCGEGALRHAPLLEDEGHAVLPHPFGLPTAQGLLRVHSLHPGAEPFAEGSRWEPAYLRGSSAVRPKSAPYPVP